MTDSNSPPSSPRPSPPNPAFNAAPGAARAGRATALLWLVLLIVAAAAAAGGYALNRKIDRANETVQARTQATQGQLADVRSRVEQTVATVNQLQVQMAHAGSQMAAAQAQQQALEQLYQELTRNRDAWTLAETEATLAVASQQLALTGNVRLALVALQSADQRLAGSSGPRIAAVRTALAADMEKLKNAPTVDLPGLARKLDDAIARVDVMPLAADTRAAVQQASAAASSASSATSATSDAASRTTSDAASRTTSGSAPGSGTTPGAPSTAVGASSTPVDASSAATAPAASFGAPGSSPVRATLARIGAWWRGLAASAGDELRTLVQVRRIDHADAMLVAPDQAYFLRSNLKLRLLSARLSLLARNQETLKADLRQATDEIDRYFDTSAASTRQVRAVLGDIAPATDEVTLPTLAGSLQAVHEYKAGN